MKNFHIELEDQKTLIITRGLPGAGKTTRARAWVAESPNNRVAVCREDIWRMLYGSLESKGNNLLVLNVENRIIETSLSVGDVVVHDNLLDPAGFEEMKKLAFNFGADVTIWDMRDVPLETCIARNARRRDAEGVSEQAIRDMHARWIGVKG